MLSYAREQLNEQLSRLSAVVDLYARNEPDFVERALEWIRETETRLQKLRNPRASLLAAERGKLLAAHEGRPEGAGRSSARRQARAVASEVLSACEASVREVIADADRRLDDTRTRLAQIVAVASAKQPIPLPPTEPRTAWLSKIWTGMSLVPEASGMVTYISATTRHVDILYLLDDLLSNLIENMPHP